MKTNHAKGPKKGPKSKSRRRGVALVTVLTIMSLATILIMTFFSLAQNEHKASTNYSDGLQAQQIAEQAVNLVIRQIRKATSNRGLLSGENLAWASQPGAIRTWQLDGTFNSGYKLYSDDKLVVTNEDQMVVEDFTEMSDWDSKPWAYVDLNEPVIRGKRVFYPIVDPIAATEPKWKDGNGNEVSMGGDTNGIEGFDFSLEGLSKGPMNDVVSARDREVLPMPAMWIYQLKDGTLGYLDESKTFQPLIPGGEQPERDNPIVSRMAFWTDDETCKLNPNVHAGGAAWATPTAGGFLDRNLGRYQPAQHEWQRYPGHPATTHLSPVIAPGIPDITYQRDNMEMIFNLVPRVVGGGSESGTAEIDLYDPKERSGLIADKDRLYPSLDEFIMQPDRSPNEFPEPGSRGRAHKPEYMQEQIERMKFFLSVVSRAPEVTIFNTPRVSIWPTYDKDASTYIETTPNLAGHHTPFDRLIRFCAELGKPEGGSDEERYKYHFQRANADSATSDYYDIPRNRELLAYLEKLTRSPIPGASGSFDDKYPKEERLQLLTEVFDYIRSTNLHDDSLFQDDWQLAFKEDNSNDHLTYTNPRRIGKHYKFTGDYDPKNQRTYHKGHGQVTPIRIDYSSDGREHKDVEPNPEEGTITTKGMGRFYTLIEMGIQIICCGDGGANLLAHPGGNVRSIIPGVWEWTPPGQDNIMHEKPSRGTPGGDQWSNYPPLPTDVKPWPVGGENHPWQKPDPMGMGGSEPHPSWGDEYSWLEKMANSAKDGEEQKVLDEAFNPANWNWQLAWMDRTYESNMPGSKYAVNALSRTKETRLLTRQDNGGFAEKCVQASLVFNMFSPSVGWVPINPDMEIDIQVDGIEFDNEGDTNGPVLFGWGEGPNGVAPNGPGLDLRAALDPEKPGPGTWASCAISRLGENRGWSGGDRTYGGVKPVPYFMRTSRPPNKKTDDLELDYSVRGQAGRYAPIDMGYAEAESYRRYSYITKPWKIKGPTVKMIGTESDPDYGPGGYVRMNIFAAGDGGVDTEQTESQADVQLVQQLELFFPDFDVPAPGLTGGHRGWIGPNGLVHHWRVQPMAMWSLSHDGPHPHVSPYDKEDSYRSPNPKHPGAPWNDSMGRDGSHLGRLGRVWHLNNVFRGEDVVQAVGIRHGDGRVVAARPKILSSDGLFTPHHFYNNERDPKSALALGGGAALEVDRPAGGRMAHNFASSPGTRAPGASNDTDYMLIPQAKKFKYDKNRRPYMMASETAWLAQRYGDFDNGMGLAVDGAYINKPDEGNTHSLIERFEPHNDEVAFFDLGVDYGPYPYFVRDYMHEAGTPAFFSPNRIISSPGMLGSLPVGSTMPWTSEGPEQRGQPWRTLLFRPNVTGSDSGSPALYDPHPGGGGVGAHPANAGVGPADHYFLDLFWMPVVEPYVISEPLSTAGKVNLNYQILPYTNITRNTALRGVFKSEYMLCIPNEWADDYKVGSGRGRGYHWKSDPFSGTLQERSLRSVILEDPTLDQFQERFDEYRIFRTASEICDIHLIPVEVSERIELGTDMLDINSYTPDVEQMRSGKYWAEHAVVGDNGRERPYSNIYTRVTTKSNTYKVHYRAQVVKQASPPGRDFSRWDEDYDTMVAEYRGSTVVERYVEPNAEDIPDYTDIKDDGDDEFSEITIDEFYKYRVINPTRFAP